MDVISHDLGTSGDKATLVDLQGKVHAFAHERYHPKYSKFYNRYKTICMKLLNVFSEFD